jgi:hypothetical protein
MNHLVWLVTRGSNAVEGAWRGEQWRRWTSFPNSVSIVPANTPLALRWRGETEFIEVELEKGFFEAAIVDEDQQPSSLELRPQISTEIPAIQRIVLNLRDDLVAGMPTGRLYGESLTMALAFHLFKAGASPESVERSLRGRLAVNRLKRVIEYINDRLEADLRVRELAQGGVGLWGQSFSASIQFNVASLQPPHLKAMIPTSNDPDQYRDIVFQGGIYYRDYRESWFYGNVAARTLRCLDQPYVDIISIFRANPFDDPRVYGPIRFDPGTGRFLPIGQVSADLSRITIPMWSVERQDVWPIHVRGPSEAYLGAASRHKRLSIEAGDEFSRAYEPATVAMHMRFFDRYLRGERGEDLDLPPPVIVDFRLPNGGWTTTWEEEWPLARTQYVRWYLDATDPARGGAMSRTAPTVRAQYPVLSRRFPSRRHSPPVLSLRRLVHVRTARRGHDHRRPHQARAPRVCEQTGHGHLRDAAGARRERERGPLQLAQLAALACERRLPEGVASEGGSRAVYAIPALAYACRGGLPAAPLRRDRAGGC